MLSGRKKSHVQVESSFLFFLLSRGKNLDVEKH